MMKELIHKAICVQLFFVEAALLAGMRREAGLLGKNVNGGG
jgi:hypothetical protein